MSSNLSFFAVLLLLSLLLLIIRNPTSKKKQLLPSPPKLPFMGNLHQLGSLPHCALHSLSQKYGPLMFLQLGRVQTVVISSADIAREIMKTYDHIFARRPPIKAARILYNDGMDVAFANGEHWKKARKLCVNHLLSSKLAPSHQHTREEAVASLISQISTISLTGSVDMSQLLGSFTNNIMCGAVLGSVSREGMDKVFCKLIREESFLLGKFYVGDYFPFLGWLDELLGLGAQTRRLAKRWDAFINEIIDDHETRLQNGDMNANASFMGVLLSLQEDPNMDLSLTRELITILVHEMILGGTDTLFVLLEWGMAELVRNSEAMTKLRDEVRKIAHGKLMVREEDLNEMRYLKAVIKEAMRLHPSGPLLIPREAKQSCQVGGYEIPMSTRVIINAWSIGRDPKFWEEPEKFKPERFLNSPVDFRSHDYQFIPFGAGRRICPGMQFAIPTLELAFANLINQFDWKLPQGMKVDDLNMEDAPGITASRKERLCLIARKVSST